MISEFKNIILGFLFPSFCVACNKPGDWWCAECRDGVQKLDGTICPKCLKLIPLIHDENCGDLPFANVWSIGYYHDPKLRAAITALKFNGTSALMGDLQRFVSDRLPSLPEGSVLVPMPLAEKRLKERGFNQAELIAGLFPGKVSSDCLRRVVHRDPQSSVAHDFGARQLNIQNCFQAVGDIPKQIILVDDVITTGATAAEAAKVLLAAGAESVSVLTLAIGA